MEAIVDKILPTAIIAIFALIFGMYMKIESTAMKMEYLTELANTKIEEGTISNRRQNRDIVQLQKDIITLRRCK